MMSILVGPLQGFSLPVKILDNLRCQKIFIAAHFSCMFEFKFSVPFQGVILEKRIRDIRKEVQEHEADVASLEVSSMSFCKMRRTRWFAFILHCHLFEQLH